VKLYKAVNIANYCCFQQSGDFEKLVCPVKGLDAVPQGLKGVIYLREELKENIISYVLYLNLCL